jgi:hypothetical protein
MLLKPSGLCNIRGEKVIHNKNERYEKPPSLARPPTDKPNIHPPLYFTNLEGNTDIKVSLDMHTTNLKNSSITV